MLKPCLLLALALVSAPLFAADAPAAAPASAAAPQAKPEAKLLKVGDAAPELKVTQWYKGGPVALEADKTYIVECWATWCGPCIGAFPHLSELATEFDGEISVIGVNVWERQKPEGVQAFVDKQGDKMKYHVAADGDGVVATQWLKAAGKTGIPCAFVVSKGKINWIGHPGQLNKELLQSILDGKLDVAALAKAAEAEAAAGKHFSVHVMPLIRSKDYAGAIGKLEGMRAEFPTQGKNIDACIARLKTEEAQKAKKDQPAPAAEAGK